MKKFILLTILSLSLSACVPQASTISVDDTTITVQFTAPKKAVTAKVTLLNFVSEDSHCRALDGDVVCTYDVSEVKDYTLIGTASDITEQVKCIVYFFGDISIDIAPQICSVK